METMIIGTLHIDSEDNFVLSISADFKELSNEEQIKICKYLKDLSQIMIKQLKRNRDNDD